MRTLRFIVDGDSISKDPTCDFSGLFNKRNDNVQAEFIFSKDWNGMVKVVAFWSILGVEYEPQLLTDGDICRIPSEAFERSAFKIQLIGKKRNEKIFTNKLTILQTGDRRV